MRKIRHPDKLGLHLRVVLPGGVVIGPGRADLLQAVREHGSISAAGRAIGMSYKRAWELIEAVNACFQAPLIEASAGGRAGGGTRLTAAGEAVLASYRRIETAAAGATAEEQRELAALLAPDAGLGAGRARATRPPGGGTEINHRPSRAAERKT